MTLGIVLSQSVRKWLTWTVLLALVFWQSLHYTHSLEVRRISIMQSLWLAQTYDQLAREVGASNRKHLVITNASIRDFRGLDVLCGELITPVGVKTRFVASTILNRAMIESVSMGEGDTSDGSVHYYCESGPSAEEYVDPEVIPN